MDNEKKQFTYNSSITGETQVTFDIQQYMNNRAMFIGLMCNEDGYEEPFGDNSDEQRMEQLFAEIERQKDIIKYLSKHHKLSSKDKIIAILVRDNWQIHNILEVEYCM